MPRAIEVAEATGARHALEDASVRRHLHAFVAPGGRRLATIRFDRLQSPYPYTLQVPQGVCEAVLEEAAVNSGLVKSRRGFQVEGIGQDTDGVWVQGVHRGGAHTVHTRLGLGAEGQGAWCARPCRFRQCVATTERAPP